MPTISTDSSVSRDEKINASKLRRFANDIGEGISSKNQKTGGDDEGTKKHEEGGAPSNTTNAQNPNLSLLDQSKAKV